jgi:hypothetical protein
MQIKHKRKPLGKHVKGGKLQEMTFWGETVFWKGSSRKFLCTESEEKEKQIRKTFGPFVCFVK